MIYPYPNGSNLRPDGGRDDSAREIESLLWLAAGAAWAIVAIKAWGQAKKLEARRRTLSISDRLLGQVFPNGIAQ